MKRRLYIALLVLLLSWVDAAAQVACPGLKNPINFAMYPSYSGRIGSKPLNSRSICGTNQLGMVFTNDIIPNTQLAAQTSVANRYFCALGTIEDNKRFRIMSYDEGTCQGWLQGRDPNTNCYLPYCPPGFEKSIRVGQCRIMAEAEALYYTMTVTPDNALVFVNYAIVVQAPGHGVTQDPEFVVRVTRQNGTSFDPISDTLCYVVSSTPVNEGGTVVLGQDGWHGDGSGDYRVFYRDWNKVAINLYNYLYQNVRIEIMICDCGGTGHYGYCYVAGDCQSMRLEVNSCAAGETEDVATIAAPSGLAAYQWYKSRTGYLTGSAANNPDNYVRIVGQTYEVLHVNESYFVTSSGSTVAQQSFMCEMTSYMDPQKPVKSQLFADVMNKKPKIAVDTILDCESRVTLIDRSYAPIVAAAGDNVDTSLTIWEFYDAPDTLGPPAEVVHGGRASHRFPGAGNYCAVVRTSARDTACWSRRLLRVRALEPPDPGFEFERNDICFRDTIAIIDTTHNSYWRRWVVHHDDGTTDTLADSARTVRLSFDSTEVVELIAGSAPAHVVDTTGEAVTMICKATVRQTIRVGKYPRLYVAGDTVICRGDTGRIEVTTDAEGCTFEWYNAIGSAMPYSDSPHIVVKPLRSTWYYVKVTTHPNGCFAWDSVFVRVVDPTLEADRTAICEGDTVWLTAGKADTYTWSADPADTTLAVWNGTGTYRIPVVPRSSTTYTMVGHGGNGCNASPLSVTITVYPYPVPRVQCEPWFVDMMEPVVTFRDLSDYGVRRLWDFGDGTISTEREVKHTFSNLALDSVPVRLTPANALGCESDTEFFLPVVLFSVWLPNTFTPGMGGENSVFRVYSGNTLEHFSLYIYDRCGLLVYRSHNQYEGWNGTNLNGRDCKEGIYAYVCSYRRPDTHDIKTHKGTVMLIR